MFRFSDSRILLGEVPRQYQRDWLFEIDTIVLLLDYFHSIEDEKDFRTHFDLIISILLNIARFDLDNCWRLDGPT